MAVPVFSTLKSRNTAKNQVCTVRQQAFEKICRFCRLYTNKEIKCEKSLDVRVKKEYNKYIQSNIYTFQGGILFD